MKEPFILTRGRFRADNSDLIVVVFEICHESDEYYEAKIGIFDINSKLTERVRNHKLYKKNIQHWKKLPLITD